MTAVIERRQSTITTRVAADQLQADDRIKSFNDLLRIVDITVAGGTVELVTRLDRGDRDTVITRWRIPSTVKLVRVQTSRKIRMRPDLETGR